MERISEDETSTANETPAANNTAEISTVVAASSAANITGTTSQSTKRTSEAISPVDNTVKKTRQASSGDEVFANEIETDVEWNTVNNRKHSLTKQPKIKEIGKVVYMAGINCNLANLAVRNGARSKAAIIATVGTVTRMETVNESIKITCQTCNQARVLLAQKTFLGEEVSVTLPRKMQQRQSTTEKSRTWYKGVIKRVDKEIPDDLIREQTGEIWVRRINARRGTDTVKTGTVILAYVTKLPETVSVGITDYSVETYYEQPTRCFRCQRYGHKQNNCRATKPTCPRCGGGHDVTACHADHEAVKCRNCGQGHSAAYKGCTKYKEVEKTLKVAADSKISYAEALKSSRQQQPSNQVQLANPQRQTARPAAA